MGILALLHAGISNINLQKLKDTASEKFDKVELSVLDSALVSYHVAHGSNLPERLTEDVLKSMGISGIDMGKYSYTKFSNNKFELTCDVNNSGKIIRSFHSGLDLGYAYAYNYELGALANGGTIDGDETDIDVSKKSVFIGDDVMIHGSVKIGDGSYGDGKHTFTHNYTIGPAANVNSDQVNIADNTQIGANANIRNFVEIIGENISVGDRVTLWSEATVGDNVNIANADKGSITFQTKIPSNTTIKRTGDGGGNLTFYSGSTITGGTNEIYNESDGSIDIYTKLPKDTTIRRTGEGNGDIIYNLASTIVGSHTINNDSNAPVEINCAIPERTIFNRSGKGNGKIILREEARLGGNCGIVNENQGYIDFYGQLEDGNVLKYTGNSDGFLIFNTIASMNNSVEINNTSKGSLEFSGALGDNVVLKLTGNGTGKFRLVENTFINGNCELYNESQGFMKLRNCIVPENVVLKNISKKGIFYLTAESSGMVSIEPDTEFIVENTLLNGGAFENWRDLNLRSGKVTLSGNGSAGLILEGKFGGTFNVINDGRYQVQLASNRFDWDGETVRFKGYIPKDVPGPSSMYCYIATDKIGSYLDIESSIDISLRGSYADNMKIRIDGKSSYGSLYFYGNYSDDITAHMTCSDGVRVDFHNSKINDFTYNAEKAGSLYIGINVDLGKGVTINNHSKRKIRISGNTVIGDGVVINVREDYPSDIEIEKSIPANTIVDY